MSGEKGLNTIQKKKRKEKGVFGRQDAYEQVN
jgi:hypothetical protein